MLDVGPLPAGLPPDVTVLRRHDLGAARASSTVPLARSAGSATDPVVIIWTSGTTGMPKGAWFDHDNLRAAVDSAGVMSAPFDRRLVTTPFAHAGYMAKLWEQLAWATTLVICPTPWSAADMVRLIGAEGITVAGGVPTQWAKLLEQPGLADTDVSRLRLCVAATAPAPPELVERVTRRARLSTGRAVRDDRVAVDHRHRTGRRSRGPVPHRRPARRTASSWSSATRSASPSPAGKSGACT